jgi:hypothetical protein
MPDILPDSRTRARAKGRVGAKPGPGGYWIPVFCAICGVPYGHVPEENCSFACWLCNECSDTHGAIFGMMLMPDEVFWKKVEEAQLEKYGRVLTEPELNQVAESDDSSFGKLLKQGI